MKKYLKKILSVLCSALVLCVNFTSYASYNDERFEIYVNMNNKVTNSYVVPNLYRQDAAYTYVKSFPLVVSGGVEYVPITEFSLFYYITVTYSKINDNFYMTNTKTGSYLSFDVENNIAESNDGVITSMKTKLYYKTRYVPARDVADILGLACESYDDNSSGIYAFRVKDSSAELSFDALLEKYIPPKKRERPDIPLPEIKDPDDDKNNPDGNDNKGNASDNPDGSNSDTGKQDPDNSKNNPQPEPEDPYKDIAPRQMFFVYTDFNADCASDIVKRFSSYSENCTFALTEQNIKDNPDFVRLAAVNGDGIALAADDVNTDGTITDSKQLANELADKYDKANDALYAALKQKIRLCVVPDGVLTAADNADTLYNELKARGYAAVKFNCTSPENYNRAYNVLSSVRRVITSYFPKNAAQKPVLKLSMSDNSAYYTGLVLGFMNDYEQFTTGIPDETMFG